MRKLDQNLLEGILTQPAAPFREGHVIATITGRLDAASVPYFIDPVGNIVIGAKDSTAYRKLLNAKSREPVRVFIAHMDHPGFHGVNWKSDRELEFKWHGGSPTAFLEGAKVWLADRDGWLGEGSVQSATLIPSGRGIDTGVIEVPAELHRKHPKAAGIFGGFGFRSPLWQEGELIYTKAADDLVGSFAIVSLALELLGKKKRGKASAQAVPFIGLLTRAEEVGFIGAIGHFEQGWIPKAKRPVICVSLETSRALPGAEIGKGPVVRLGDRTTVFHPGALKVFSDLATRLLPDRHQKRIMDGGSCEATAVTVYGGTSIGISVPLGNYHNQCFEGGPDSRGSLGPAPEFVHLGDVAGLLALCRGLLKPKLPWNAPWEDRKKQFKNSFMGYGPLLRSGP